VSRGSTVVVLTGVGLDGGPDIIRALRADADLRARVVGVDTNPAPAARYLCDAFHTVPPRGDPEYLETVVGIAQAEAAQVIYPLPTFDQEIFGEARGELAERGLAVPVSAPEPVRTCNDKWLLYERLERSLPAVVPETRRVTSADELARTARAFGYPDRRVCIRRRVSRGAIGLRILDGGPGRLRALLEQNPGSLLVSLDEVLDCLGHAESFPEYLVQEYLPGDEWDVDVLCRGGVSQIVVTRRNLAMVAGGAAESVLERSSEISDLTRQVVAEVGLDAVVNVAFRHDAHGRPKLLEINPRVPLSILAGLGGGVNLVALAVRQALGETIEAAEPNWGGRFLRHLHSVVLDASGNRVVPQP
jgi:carbamoyl-phosphate synthase large subunit